MSITAVAPSAVSAPPEPTLPPSMVERMTLILDAFQGRTAQLTLEQVARRSALPRSTAHRILHQLVRLEWVEQMPLGYRLGRRAIGLAGRYEEYDALRPTAAPFLHELQVRTGLVVHLAVLQGTEVYYLDKVGGRFATAVPSRVGGRAPAHCTALGKSMLALLDAEAVDRRMAQCLGPRTPRTIRDLDALHLELGRVRHRHGLAFEKGECFAELSCVAAGFWAGDDVLASISVVAGNDAPLERIAPMVLAAARRVGGQLEPGRNWAASTLASMHGNALDGASVQRRSGYPGHERQELRQAQSA